MVMVPLLTAVAWLPYAERKIIGYMQIRIGPNRVGPRGWLQPIADALKLIFKEIIIPATANKFLFLYLLLISFGSNRLMPAKVNPVAVGLLGASLGEASAKDEASSKKPLGFRAKSPWG